MRYVILRDDDTNTLTPVTCLERLYRPFLQHGLAVNLGVIPKVNTITTQPDGRPEGYLLGRKSCWHRTLPISLNQDLVHYLQTTPGYHVALHGYHHSWDEFDRTNPHDIGQRLDRGLELLLEAGFARPTTFIAPWDKLSRASFSQAARRFAVISTGWFELHRLPVTWWPAYLLKKIRRTAHWRVNSTLLLSHPGCILSYRRPLDSMLAQVKKAVQGSRLTVLVTHWWEYFRDNQPDEPFIRVLHEVAEFLASEQDIRVLSFDDIAARKVAL